MIFFFSFLEPKKKNHITFSIEVCGINYPTSRVRDPILRPPCVLPVTLYGCMNVTLSLFIAGRYQERLTVTSVTVSFYASSELPDGYTVGRLLEEDLWWEVCFL